MAKALGIIALILGILCLTPIPSMIPGLPFWVLPLVAIVLGIIGAATSGGNYSRAPSIVGIVFGVIGIAMQFVWSFILAFLGLGLGGLM